MDAVPMPKKNSFIIGTRPKRSASQPAGIEHAPNAMNPPIASGRSDA
jgi:hypothetical protein